MSVVVDGRVLAGAGGHLADLLKGLEKCDVEDALLLARLPLRALLAPPLRLGAELVPLTSLAGLLGTTLLFEPLAGAALVLHVAHGHEARETLRRTHLVTLVGRPQQARAVAADEAEDEVLLLEHRLSTDEDLDGAGGVLLGALLELDLGEQGLDVGIAFDVAPVVVARRTVVHIEEVVGTLDQFVLTHRRTPLRPDRSRL